jgi:hypothetical protein
MTPGKLWLTLLFGLLISVCVTQRSASSSFAFDTDGNDPFAGTGGLDNEGQPEGKTSSTPRIIITSISAKEKRIRGKVENLEGPAKDYCIVCYVRTDIWYVHPKTGADAIARIDEDGSWTVRHVVRGEEKEVGVVLARRPFDPPEKLHSLESVKDTLATTQIEYQAEFRAQGASLPRVVRFAGRVWEVKSSTSDGPGPNAWSNSQANVSVDKKGHLHLAITQEKEKWYCSEVSLKGSLGYGTYQWSFAGNLEHLDPQTVFSVFLYADDRHEMDFELSRWGRDEPRNAQFVIQPASKETTYSFSTGAAKDLTCRLEWQSGRAQWKCWEGENVGQKPLAVWTFSGERVPRPGRERARANLWLFRARSPATEAKQEIVIRSFAFEPATRPER